MILIRRINSFGSNLRVIIQCLINWLEIQAYLLRKTHQMPVWWKVVMEFQDLSLDSRLKTAISKAGYESPTPIQEQALPIALQGKDVIGIAQTGTGKTAVFALTVLQKMLQGPRKKPRALIVTPTRELAKQIYDNIKMLSGTTKVRAVTIYGGVSPVHQIEIINRGVEILVACPGRLLDLINQKVVSLNDIEILVLDEADRMMDMGFMPDVRRIVKHIGHQHQTMLFTATFPREIASLAGQMLDHPVKIDVGFSNPAETVNHALYPVPFYLKTKLLLRILKETETDSVLVFTRTRRRTYRLQKKIHAAGYKVTSLHGDRSQNQRDAAMDGFKKGTYQVMIATDIAARGLDVDTISHVINYDIPDTVDAYVHRIGRTGRAERKGVAFTLITEEDTKTVKAIEQRLGYSIKRVRFADFDYNAPQNSPQPANQNEAQKNRHRRSSRSSKSGYKSNSHTGGKNKSSKNYSRSKSKSGNQHKSRTHK